MVGKRQQRKYFFLILYFFTFAGTFTVTFACSFAYPSSFS